MARGKRYLYKVTGFDSRRFERRKKRLAATEKEIECIEEFIYAIKDSLTMQVFEIRYMKRNKTWENVAKEVPGNYSEDYIRQCIHDKYLKK